MSDSKTEEQKINIELDEATAEGTYFNLAIIKHTFSLPLIYISEPTRPY